MQYCRMKHIVIDSNSIPDGEIFTVYNEDNETWAFAMRINKQFTLTRFQSQKVDKHGAMTVLRQIRFAKEYGWSYTGQKTWNTEVDDHQPEFCCLYCKDTTYDISKPCKCRNKQPEDMVKTSPSGIILPI